MTGNRQRQIRDFRAGDEEAINALFNRAFGRQRPLEQWRWKFQSNPASRVGPMNIVVGEADGRIVSTFASMARDLWLRGTPRAAVQIVDAVVHPEFRKGRHFLKDMVAYFNAQMTAGGNELMFGCPNEVHYRVGKRLLGYRDLFPVRRLYRRLALRLALRQRLPAPLRPLAEALGGASARAARLALRPRHALRYRVEERADERFERLWQLARGRFALLGARDRGYVQWRYFERPDVRFRVLGAGDAGRLEAWVALAVAGRPDGSRVGTVADFLYADPAPMGELLRQALRELSRMGADYALALAAPGSEAEALLRGAGFGEHEAFGPLQLSVTWHAMREPGLQAAVGDPAGWHLCHGDLDLEL